MKSILDWNGEPVESDEGEPTPAGTKCEECGRTDVPVWSFTWRVPDPYSLLLCEDDATAEPVK